MVFIGKRMVERRFQPVLRCFENVLRCFESVTSSNESDVGTLPHNRNCVNLVQVPLMEMAWIVCSLNVRNIGLCQMETVTTKSTMVLVSEMCHLLLPRM